MSIIKQIKRIVFYRIICSVQEQVVWGGFDSDGPEKSPREADI